MAIDTRGHRLALLVTPINVEDRGEIERLAKVVQASRGQSVDFAPVERGQGNARAASAAKAQGIDPEVAKLPEADRGFALHAAARIRMNWTPIGLSAPSRTAV